LKEWACNTQITAINISRRGLNMLKAKKQGASLEIRTFTSTDEKNQYVVFRSLDGSYHTFVEVEAKQAARECGAEEGANTRQMWESIWK
jgi:hypothetical protein